MSEVLTTERVQSVRGWCDYDDNGSPFGMKDQDILDLCDSHEALRAQVAQMHEARKATIAILKDRFRQHPISCRMLSQGAECSCSLCLLDSLTPPPEGDAMNCTAHHRREPCPQCVLENMADTRIPQANHLRVTVTERPNPLPTQLESIARYLEDHGQPVMARECRQAAEKLETR